MRDLVNGGAACAVPGSSSSSNPLGALTNALLGSSSKTQVSFLISFCDPNLVELKSPDSILASFVGLNSKSK